MSDEHDEHTRATRAKIIAAFAVVYIVWGSSYFAIRVGLEAVPPFLLPGIRFLLAGSALVVWARRTGAPRPTRAQWRVGAVTGTLMLLVGNGGVTFSEQRAPSGLVALMVSIVPLWMVIIEWLRPGGVRPGKGVWIGILAGSCGIVLLVDPGASLHGAAVPPFEALLLLLSTLGWAAGSLYSRHTRVEGSTLMLAGLQMLVASGLFLIIALVRGELDDVRAAGPIPWLAVAYLAVFGSVVAYSSYVWLTRATTPARLATYAYVNPIVALILGALLGNEPITLRVLIAAALVIVAVIAMSGLRAGTGPSRSSAQREESTRSP